MHQIIEVYILKVSQKLCFESGVKRIGYFKRIGVIHRNHLNAKTLMACLLAELTPGAWNEKVTTGSRAERRGCSDGCDWHTYCSFILYDGPFVAW